MIKKILYYIIILLAFQFSNAQVGIGTTNPQGILDINSTEYGVVYPTVDLVSTTSTSPVLNPDGSTTLAIGTTVFNKNTTNTGADDVKPGIYSWDGSHWVTHFFKRQSEKHEQTSVLRTRSLLGYQDIPGLESTSNLKFTAKYSGTYKIKINANYGGGRVVTNTGMHTVTAKGNFRFHFDGTNYEVPTKAFSSYHPDVGSGKHYENVWKETITIEYVTLTAGQEYDFYLQFDQTSGSGFQNNGNNNNGRGYIGTDVPCVIEFTYLNE